MPDRRRTIVARLRLTIALGVVVFACLATLAAFLIAGRAEDHVLGKIMQSRIDGRFESSLFTKTSLEELAPEIAAVLGEGPGPVEVHLGDGEEIMAYQPDSQGSVYLFDVEDMEDSADGVLELSLTLPALVLLGVLFIFVPVTLVTSRLLRPLGRLADAIAQTQPGERLQIDEDLRRRPDEVGLLAAALSAMLNRVDGFVERERRFSRDASHELRTPVTVANGAIDLLRRNRSLDAAAERAIERIARANDDMHALIDAFLLLARESDLEDLYQHLLVSELIDDAIGSHAAQIERRALTIERHCSVDPSVSAPLTIARIIMRNLVRNAVSHAAGETIVIACAGDPAQLSISNRADPPSDDERRRGFGLTIVADCCRRLGWPFTIAAEADTFVVTITFEGSGKNPHRAVSERAF